MTWERITGSGIGWAVAFVVGLVTIIFWAMGSVSKEVALPTLAICAVRL